MWLAENDFILKLQIHHIVFDGWSFGVTTRELSTLYRAFAEGRPSPLPELPIRYADFAAWQRQYLQGETLERLQDYWRTQLSGLPPLDLPTDFPRPAIRTSRGATLPLAFSPELTQAVVDFSRRERVTTFMTLLAGFEELLHRYSGQEDFALGTPTANRRQKNVEPLIGYFINMLVLRADLSGDPSFRQLVQRVRADGLGGLRAPGTDAGQGGGGRAAGTGHEPASAVPGDVRAAEQPPPAAASAELEGVFDRRLAARTDVEVRADHAVADDARRDRGQAELQHRSVRPGDDPADDRPLSDDSGRCPGRPGSAAVAAAAGERRRTRDDPGELERGGVARPGGKAASPSCSPRTPCGSRRPRPSSTGRCG